MSKRVLAILVVALLAVGIFSAVVNAGVEGEFTLDILMWPQTDAREISKLDFDIEGHLTLAIAVSGLTVGIDSSFGIAGLEYSIISLDTTLGALDLADEFVFAVPYIECGVFGRYAAFPGYRGWLHFYYDIPLVPKAGGLETYPCRPIGDLLFVKKRVNLEITIGGLTVNSLIMFEDVNFPWPDARSTTEMPIDPDTGLPDGYCDPTDPQCEPIDAPEYDDSYTTEDQEFRFGTILGISGTTVSGIDITAKTGICADWRIRYYYWMQWYPKFYDYLEFEAAYNVIKKNYWTETVCRNFKLEFTKEFLAIENLQFAGLTMNNYLIWTMWEMAFEGYSQLQYTIMDLVTITMWFNFVAPEYLELAPVNWIDIVFGNSEIIWQDINSDLTLTAEDYIYFLNRIPVQNTTIVSVIEFIPTLGIDYLLLELDAPISFPEPIGNLAFTAEFWNDYWVTENPADWGPIQFRGIEVELEKNFGEHNTFYIDCLFTAEQLEQIEVAITTTFSL